MLPVPWLRHGFSFVWVTSFFGWKLETTTDILQIGVTKASWGRRSTSGCSKNLTSHLKVNHESFLILNMFCYICWTLDMSWYDGFVIWFALALLCLIHFMKISNATNFPVSNDLPRNCQSQRSIRMILLREFSWELKFWQGEVWWGLTRWMLPFGWCIRFFVILPHP